MKWLLSIVVIVALTAWLFSTDGKKFRDRVLGVTDSSTQLIRD